MKLTDLKKIFFCGIGGIGVSAIARILNEKGIIVKGSDISESDLTNTLENEGISVFYKHDENNLDEDTELFIYTTAIKEDNPEFSKAKKHKIKTLTYAEALAKLSEEHKLIAITGTHGKTTTTAFTSLILEKNNEDPTIIVGTLLKELANKNYKSGKSNYLVIEACEYKEAFLNYNPYILIITNIEKDHLDYYKTEENYINAFKKLANKMEKNSYIIYDPEDENTLKALKETKAIKTPFNKYTLNLKISGLHNEKNASMALTASEILRIDKEKAIKVVENYNGAWRRMEEKQTKLNIDFFDDFAHHPTEIKATLKALREKNTNKKILAIFQPHTYNRTKELLYEFAKSFKDADLVIIPDIFEARDSKKDIESVNTDILVNEINKISNNAINGKGLEHTAKFIKENEKDFDIAITMGGSGNVDDLYLFL